jgi:hypothetical protein
VVIALDRRAQPLLQATPVLLAHAPRLACAAPYVKIINVPVPPRTPDLGKAPPATSQNVRWLPAGAEPLARRGQNPPIEKCRAPNASPQSSRGTRLKP